MRTVVALLAVGLLALAGCSSKGPDNYTCLRTGKVIDLKQVSGSGAKGFDPESACPAPTPPSVIFTKVPTTMEAYHSATVAWIVSSGNYTAGHSMFNGVVLFHHPVDNSSLVAPDPSSTTSTLCNFQHQDVPAPFSCKVKFTTPGTYSLRAYAQVRGNGLNDGDYWTPDVKVTVTPVNATGVNVVIAHAAGPVTAAGQGGVFGPAPTKVNLGDGIILDNKDVMDHTFTFSGVCKATAAAKVTMGQQSPPITMLLPGSCTITTDDPQAQQVSFSVTEPA